MKTATKTANTSETNLRPGFSWQGLTTIIGNLIAITFTVIIVVNVSQLFIA